MIVGDSKVYYGAIPLYQKLESEFACGKWSNIILCSAFLSSAAARDIISIIDNLPPKKATKITFLIGIKQYFTKPDAIRTIIDYKRKCRNPKLTLQIMRPIEFEFHLKCYMFSNERSRKALVGSANLTSTGLESVGELMIETDNLEAFEDICSYVDCFLMNSVEWESCIDEYSKLYQTYKPSFESKNRFRKPKKREITKIEHTAPTTNSLFPLENEDEFARINELYKELKKSNKQINKTNSIKIYGEKRELLKKYKEGYSFDRAWEVSDDGWEIGKKRAICVIGAVGITEYDEVILYMKSRSRIEYEVTQDRVKMAEKYGIKPKNLDDERTPTQSNIEKYKRFILNTKESR